MQITRKSASCKITLKIDREPFCLLFVSDTVPEWFGVSTGAVPDDAFSASSSKSELSAPQRGRASVKEEGSFTGMAIVLRIEHVLYDTSTITYFNH